jgi:hypothetical protein
MALMASITLSSFGENVSIAANAREPTTKQTHLQAHFHIQKCRELCGGKESGGFSHLNLTNNERE